MSEPIVKVRVHAPSGTIVLNRPERRNALSRDMLQEIWQALSDLHQEKRVRAVILTGAGTAFCSGMDLQEMQETAQREDAMQLWREDAVLYRDVLTTMMAFPKPIIAAVNGPAIAGGAGLVLASDLVLACAEATFGLPEPRRGLVAGLVAPMLAFRVGGGRAAQLLLSAEVMSAERMLHWGVYHELTENHKAWALAHQWAEQAAKSAPEAIQLTKRMLYETIGEHLEVQLASGAAASATARTTEAAAEGLAAF